MLTFGVIELQGRRHRVQHRFRDADEIPAFEAGVVDDADAGDGCNLLTAKTGHPAVVTKRSQPRLLRGEPRTARGEELAHLAPVITGIAHHAFEGSPLPHGLGVTTVIPHAKQLPGPPHETARESKSRSRSVDRRVTSKR
ncbi:MAG: hypothetical protein QOJ18_26 [Microbacteriaceae bacterium]|nr:hypothetical protein [Microbacteriaceae bacterium]